MSDIDIKNLTLPARCILKRFYDRHTNRLCEGVIVEISPSKESVRIKWGGMTSWYPIDDYSVVEVLS